MGSVGTVSPSTHSKDGGGSFSPPASLGPANAVATPSKPAAGTVSVPQADYGPEAFPAGPAGPVRSVRGNRPRVRKVGEPTPYTYRQSQEDTLAEPSLLRLGANPSPIAGRDGDALHSTETQVLDILRQRREVAQQAGTTKAVAAMPGIGSTSKLAEGLQALGLARQAKAGQAQAEAPANPSIQPAVFKPGLQQNIMPGDQPDFGGIFKAKMPFSGISTLPILPPWLHAEDASPEANPLGDNTGFAPIPAPTSVPAPIPVPVPIPGGRLAMQMKPGQVPPPIIPSAKQWHDILSDLSENAKANLSGARLEELTESAKQALALGMLAMNYTVAPGVISPRDQPALLDWLSRTITDPIPPLPPSEAQPPIGPNSFPGQDPDKARTENAPRPLVNPIPADTGGTTMVTPDQSNDIPPITFVTMDDGSEIGKLPWSGGQIHLSGNRTQDRKFKSASKWVTGRRTQRGFEMIVSGGRLSTAEDNYGNLIHIDKQGSASVADLDFENAVEAMGGKPEDIRVSKDGQTLIFELPGESATIRRTSEKNGPTIQLQMKANGAVVHDIKTRYREK